MPRPTQALSLQPESIQNLVHKIAAELKPQTIILFGSRARKTHRENSDFDIVCKFQKRDDAAWTKFLIELHENAWTLWPVDLVDYSDVSIDYQKNIHQEGVALYE